MQADADYRAFAEGLRNVYVRSRDGKPIPVTALAQVSMTTGPDLVERYNVFPAARVQIGRASCRERVCQYGSIAVDAVSLTKKQTTLYLLVYIDEHNHLEVTHHIIHKPV